MTQLTKALFSLVWIGAMTSLYGVGAPASIPQPDFFSSMGWHKTSNVLFKKNNFLNNTPEAKSNFERLMKFKLVYDRNMEIGRNPKAKVLIPKIIHQIWIGQKTPPVTFEKSQESLKRLHPDWEYKLWTDADIPNLKLHNKKYYDLAENLGAKADILRYELLLKYGGVYLDVDFICIKPLDWLLKYTFFAGAQPLDCAGHLCNCIIGAIPNHPILKDCVQALGKSWDNNPEKQKNIVDTVGPLHFQRSVMKFIDNKNLKLMILPSGFFFPIDFTKRLSGLEGLNSKKTKKSRRKAKSLLLPETHAIHYWTSTWWDSGMDYN